MNIKDLNKEVPRINSKKFKKISEKIEEARKLMVNEFGLNLQIKINNKMSYLGYLEILEEKNGIVNKFGDIYIKTTGKNLNMIFKTIAHEFSHITYSNIHLKGNKISKYACKHESSKHCTLSQKMYELILSKV